VVTGLWVADCLVRLRVVIVSRAKSMAVSAISRTPQLPRGCGASPVPSMRPHSGQQLFAKLVARSKDASAPAVAGSASSSGQTSIIQNQQAEIAALKARLALLESATPPAEPKALPGGRPGKRPRAQPSTQPAAGGEDAPNVADTDTATGGSDRTSSGQAKTPASKRPQASAGSVSLPPSLVALIPPQYRHAASLGNDPESLARWREERRRRYPTAAVRAAAAAKALEASKRGEYAHPAKALGRTRPVYPGRTTARSGAHARPRQDTSKSTSVAPPAKAAAPETAATAESTAAESATSPTGSLAIPTPAKPQAAAAAKPVTKTDDNGGISDHDDADDAPPEEIPSLKGPLPEAVPVPQPVAAASSESKEERRERRQRERAKAARARADTQRIQGALAPSLAQRVLRGPIVRETTIALQIFRRLVSSNFYKDA
jgi:hypothetical protein